MLYDHQRIYVKYSNLFNLLLMVYHFQAKENIKYKY